MAEYIDKEIALNALERKKKETEESVLKDTHSIIKDSNNCGRLFGVSDSQRIVYDISPADVVEREKIDKAIDEIIEKSFISDIYNDRTDDEIIKLDDVLEILKRI